MILEIKLKLIQIKLYHYSLYYTTKLTHNFCSFFKCIIF